MAGKVSAQSQVNRDYFHQAKSVIRRKTDAGSLKLVGAGVGQRHRFGIIGQAGEAGPTVWAGERELNAGRGDVDQVKLQLLASDRREDPGMNLQWTEACGYHLVKHQ